MRIVILVEGFPPRWAGGTETATYNLAKNLIKRGHQVHVITTWDKGLPEEELAEGLHIHRIFHGKTRGIGMISFWTKMLFHIRNIDSDIVHVQTITGIGIPALFAKKLFNIEYVVCARGSDIYTSWKHKKRIASLLLKNAAVAIALTEDMKKAMQREYMRDVVVVPNGVDLEKFRKFPRPPVKRGKRIIFIGSLRQVKGTKYLIEAMTDIKKSDPDAELTIIGEGPDRGDLVKQVKELNLEDRIKFIGKIANEDIPEHLFSSDVLVLPSLSEGFPVVIIEAMAAGLPIVTTNVRGLADIVVDGVNGFIVKPENPKEISEKVKRILSSAELRKRMSENNGKKAEDYSWEKIGAIFEKIYLSVKKDQS